MEILNLFQLNVSQAARNLGATSGFRSSSTEVVDWCGNENPPSSEALNAEVSRLEAAYLALAYSRSRATAYAALNQDEMRYDDLVNSTTTWPDAIAAIKLEFPK